MTMATAESERRTGARAIDRAIALLEVFYEVDGAISLSDLAARLQLPSSTVHRVAQALLRGDLLAQDPETENYNLGAGLVNLGQVAAKRIGLSRAIDVLNELVAETQETAGIAVLRGLRAHMLARVETDNALRVHLATGPFVGLHCTAVGKLLLAYSKDPAQMIADLQPLKSYTPETVTDPGKLLEEFAAIRDYGYAVNEGQMNFGVRALAVPIPGPSGDTAAGLCIEAPAVRLGDDRLDDLIAKMRHAAERIAKVATFDGPP